MEKEKNQHKARRAYTDKGDGDGGGDDNSCVEIIVANHSTKQVSQQSREGRKESKKAITTK